MPRKSCPSIGPSLAIAPVQTSESSTYNECQPILTFENKFTNPSQNTDISDDIHEIIIACMSQSLKDN